MKNYFQLLNAGLFLCAALLFSAPTFADDSAIKIASNGAPTVKIVLPDAPTIQERKAADELADYLRQISGASFEILDETTFDAKDGGAIFVGQTTAARKIVDFDALHSEEIRLQALENNSLILAGEGTRGTLYAVYSFLQDVCGVRWWSSKESFVPKKAELEIPGDLNVQYFPPLISREVYHRDARTPEFAARMKLNGHNVAIPAELGGNMPILGWCHTFDSHLSPEKYFHDHPDWFSEIDGKRTDYNSQICVTNPEATKEAIANILQRLRENPDTKIIDVSQNDNTRYCRCATCEAFNKAEGSPMGAHLAFVNQVADAVATEFPDVLVETLAYQYTRQAPKTIRPRDNVVIRLCTIECSWLRPVDDPQNEKFLRDLNDWKKIAKRLYIWDYTTNYTDYLGPFPNRRSLGPNLKIFVDSGAIGLFEESEGDDFCEMRNWVLARLAWNPALDPEELFDEFQRGYYGEEVAPFVKRYWDVLIKRAEDVDLYAGCFSCDVGQWLDLATLNQATEIMTQAVETAKRVYGEDSAELRRLEKSKIALDSVWVRYYLTLKYESKTKNLPFGGPIDPAAATGELAAKCARFESCPFDIGDSRPASEYYAQFKQGFDAYKNPPEFCKDYEQGEYLICDAASFVNVDGLGTLVDDQEGWNGKSIEMGTKVDWNVQQRPPVQGRYRVFASLRLEGALRDRKSVV